jgi:hexokinase
MLDLWQSLLRALRALMTLPSIIQTAFFPGLKPKRVRDVPKVYGEKKMDEFQREVKRLFESPLQLEKLLEFSEKLQRQFEQKLQSSTECFLPSFNHTLPTGNERGTYLALDVGGSTFRVAVVRLNGKNSGDDEMVIAEMRSFKIDNDVKKLKGNHFFDWMAEKIEVVLDEQDVKDQQSDTPLSMGLAWSFPIEYDHLSSRRTNDG